MLSALFAIASFLQPGNLPGCSEYPRPACFMPDIPSLEFRPQDSRYKWPLENNDPPIAITYHRRPAVYGAPPSPFFREYCLIDEARRTADCYNEWEYQTYAYCNRDRWLWMANNTFGGVAPYFSEFPELYHEYRSSTAVYIWGFDQFVARLPRVGAEVAPQLSFQVDRIQVVRRGPTTFFAIAAVLMVKEPDKPLFRDAFDWHSGAGGRDVYDGTTSASPSSVTQKIACTAAFIGTTNWCSLNPNRPEC